MSGVKAHFFKQTLQGLQATLEISYHVGAQGVTERGGLILLVRYDITDRNKLTEFQGFGPRTRVDLQVFQLPIANDAF